MYGHALALSLLSETYGMVRHESLREVVSSGVRLTIKAQHVEGGWQYAPKPQDADVSVTACQLMAQNAARDAGFAVPEEVLGKSVEYLAACQNEDGSFRYMLTGGDSSSTFPRSAAAVAVQMELGIKNVQSIDRGLDDLQPFSLALETDGNFIYGHF